MLERDRARERASGFEKLSRRPATTNSWVGGSRQRKSGQVSCEPPLIRRSFGRKRSVVDGWFRRIVHSGGQSAAQNRSGLGKLLGKSRARVSRFLSYESASESGKLLREWKQALEKEAKKKAANTQINHKLQINKSRGNRRPIKGIARLKQM